jgi:site-specific recombinase XerD
MEPALPASQASASPPKRGRPYGIQAQLTSTILSASKQLTIQHFAFLRATALGLDPRQNAERYLPDYPQTDNQTARDITQALIHWVRDAAQDGGDTTLKQAAAQLDVAHTPHASQDTPTLDQFAARFDEDMYTEKELAELYKEEYHYEREHELAPSSQTARLDALHHLQTYLARQPSKSDALAQWLAPTLSACLRAHGIHSLQDLTAYIATHGRTWHRLITGLGRTTAARLHHWLQQNKPNLDRNGQKPTPSHNTPLALLTSSIPAQLDGSAGRFRAVQDNTLRASNDPQAIQAWFHLLAEKSPHTIVAYRREVERFYLWALREQGKALSSLDALDCAAYVDFLRAPPAHWLQALPYPRSHPDWRPLRKPLSNTSIQRSQAAIMRLFQDLVDANYLTTNPMPRSKSLSATQATMDVMRSFDHDDQVRISSTLEALPDTPNTRRLRALLMLLLGCGLRITETKTTWAAILQARGQTGTSTTQVLRVLGKGNKERIIPLREDVLQALLAHRKDMEQHQREADHIYPLLGTLRVATGQSHTDQQGTMLSVAGMQSILKRFFVKVGKQNTGQSASADFAKASAHWLRHTFAHEVLSATNNDLQLVQQLLGHSAITTTAIYTTPHLAQRKKGIDSMCSPLLNRKMNIQSA